MDERCRNCGQRQKQLTDVVDPKAIAKAGQIILQEYREQIESQQACRADLNVAPDHRNRAEWLALWLQRNDDPSVNLLIFASILARDSGIDLSEVPELEGFINRWLDVAERETERRV